MLRRNYNMSNIILVLLLLLDIGMEQALLPSIFSDFFTQTFYLPFLPHDASYTLWVLIFYRFYR